MAATNNADAHPNPPSMAVKVFEMNEESKEFNRSLVIDTQDGEIHPPSGDASSKAIDTISTPSPDDLDHVSRAESSNMQDSLAQKQDHSSSDVLTREKQFIAPKDFELLKVIGMGAFGKVLQVRNRHSSKIYAMKVISKRLIKRKGSYVENILAERNILKKIANHPFIVTMHASFQTKEKLFIIMDLCAGGELFLKLGREGIFLERTAAFYLAEITLALEHLHSINVLHRDLKPENILLGSDGHCCLTDFGLAKDFTGNGVDDNERARTLCGTCEYMAPEMVARKWYGKGADFWSLGCIAYEMLSGQPPFSSNKGSKELFRKIMNERVRMPDGASAAACKLLKGLLNRDAGNRLGAARGNMFEVGGVGALKLQPFFAGLDWGKLELKEINPPEEFSVDNDEDLRHFHDEFVNMDLPRSVKEMSKLDFLPRHCESEHFRGFSFIGEGFPLPERNSMEKEHYWNNCDEDGQSLSECASSVFDDDFEEITAPEPTFEKKKRPPRKKKNKQPIPPLETTDEGIEPTEKKSLSTTERVVDEKDVLNSAVLNKDSLSLDGGESVLDLNSSGKPPQPFELKQLGGSTDKIVSPPLPVTENTPNASVISLNPNAKAWSGPALLTTHVSHSVTKDQAATPHNIVQPKPITWASMAGKTEKTDTRSRDEIRLAVAATPTVVSSISRPHSPRSPARSNASNTDWRTHIVTRHKGQTQTSTKRQNLTKPPPTIVGPGPLSWPTLDDFPPPPGAKREPTPPAKPMGVWGRRS